MIITDQPVQKSQPVFKKCKAILAIHGGAGGTLPPNIPPELDRAYRDALRRSLIKGYEVMSKGGSALDAVCESVQEMEDDPLFNAAKGAVFTTAGTNECEASVMSAPHPSQIRDAESRRCASAILVRRTKNPILLAKMLFENARENPHVILSDSTAEELGWKNGLDKVDCSYYHTRRRWLEHRRDLGLPDDENDMVARRRSVDSALDPPPSYSAHSISTDGTPSLDDDDAVSEKHRDTTTEANTPSNRSVLEEDLGVHNLIHWDVNFDTHASDQGGSDIASRGSGSFEQLSMPQNTSRSSLHRHRSLTHSTESLPAGTVGAVALDKDGNLAVATSTGGITNKLPGRVGDTPIPGAGFYAEYWKEPSRKFNTTSPSKEVRKEERIADEKSRRISNWSPCEWIRWIFCSRSDMQQHKDEEDAIDQASNLATSGSSEKNASEQAQIHRGVAISGTGTGDFFLRTSFSSLLAHRMRFLGEGVDMAGKRAVAELGEAGGVGGAICIDEKGRVSFPMNSSTMNRGYISDGGVPCVAIHADEKM